MSSRIQNIQISQSKTPQSESNINYLPDSWKKEQRVTFGKQVYNHIDKYLTKITNVKIVVKEFHKPQVKDSYEIQFNLYAPQVDEFELEWKPTQKKLTNNLIQVNKKDRGKGIGSELTKMTEELANSLGCEKLTMESIISQSALKYWSERKDFTYKPGEAVKYLK